jgi:hypothetical protein
MRDKKNLTQRHGGHRKNGRRSSPRLAVPSVFSV